MTRAIRSLRDLRVTALPAHLTLQLPPTLQQASAAGQALCEFITQYYADPAFCTTLELVAAELLTNVVRHGTPQSPIRLHAICTKRMVSICVVDDAHPFDMSRPAAAQPPSQLAESGRGLWIIRSSMDRFRYRHYRAMNIHRVMKRVAPNALREG